MEKQRKIEEAKRKEEELKMKKVQAQLVSYKNSVIFFHKISEYDSENESWIGSFGPVIFAYLKSFIN